MSGCRTIAAPVGIAVAADEVRDAGREDLGAELGQDRERRHRSRLGRLQNERVARRQSRGDLPDRHHHRVVPRGDLADDADRLAADPRRVALQVLPGRAAVHVPGGSREVAEVVAHEGNLVLVEGRARLAGVRGLDVGELVCPLLDPVGELEQQRHAIAGRGDAPGLKRLLGGLDGGVDVALARQRGLGDHLARGGVDDVLTLVVGRRNELAVDHVLEGDSPRLPVPARSGASRVSLCCGGGHLSSLVRLSVCCRVRPLPACGPPRRLPLPPGE